MKMRVDEVKQGIQVNEVNVRDLCGKRDSSERFRTAVRTIDESLFRKSVDESTILLRDP
jgi:hypothetical protein